MSKTNRIAFCNVQRIKAIIIGITMLFVVLFSTFYIAAEVGHDCKSEDCLICVCIQQCENSIRNIECGTVVQTLSILLVVAFLLKQLLYVAHICQPTLITQKVRLNN